MKPSPFNEHFFLALFGVLIQKSIVQGSLSGSSVSVGFAFVTLETESSKDKIHRLSPEVPVSSSVG